MYTCYLIIKLFKDVKWLEEEIYLISKIAKLHYPMTFTKLIIFLMTHR